jgi:hypothetical protein
VVYSLKKFLPGFLPDNYLNKMRLIAFTFDRRLKFCPFFYLVENGKSKFHTVETRIGVDETVGIPPLFVDSQAGSQGVGQTGLGRRRLMDPIGPLLLS